MSIATAEIGANIVEHCAVVRPTNLTMDVAMLADRVRVEFVDDGGPVTVPLDLQSVQMPDEMAERGRGLALARAVLDELIYHRTQLNHWTLVSRGFA
jgi:serine/threonine-protein kinase RsbW